MNSRLGKTAVILGATILLSSHSGATPILLDGSGYTQDFDTLANSGTSSTLPNGWAFSEDGTNANTTYAAGTGSSNAGDTYSFGASGSPERALGGLLSGSLVPLFGVEFNNGGLQDIIALNISYIGEQWRLGALNRPDRLDFQYSLDATSLTTGTWSDFDSLDFVAPNTGPIVGALDGNVAANRTALSGNIGSLVIPGGSGFWLRWTDLNASGSDDGLAIDDFSITAVFAATPTTGNGIPDAGGSLALLAVSLISLRFLSKRS